MPKPSAISEHACKIILEIIPTGRTNALTARQITALTGIGERSIQKAVEKLRCRGYKIFAGIEKPFGYFFAADLEEVREWDRQISARINTQCVVRAFMRQSYNLTEDQGRLELTGS